MTLTLEIPDDVYRPLLKKAEREGTTPERIALASILNASQIDEDPIIKLLGAFRSEATNVSEHHDDYIGKSIADSSTID